MKATHPSNPIALFITPPPLCKGGGKITGLGPAHFKWGFSVLLGQALYTSPRGRCQFYCYKGKLWDSVCNERAALASRDRAAGEEEGKKATQELRRAMLIRTDRWVHLCSEETKGIFGRKMGNF